MLLRRILDNQLYLYEGNPAWDMGGEYGDDMETKKQKISLD